MANHLGGYPSIYQGVSGNDVFYGTQTPQGPAVLGGKQSQPSRIITSPTRTSPIPIATYFLTDTTGATTLVTPSFTPSVGEIIVVKETSETSNSTGASLPTGGGLTFTKHQEIATTNNDAYAVIWSATVGSSTSMTITVNKISGGLNWSTIVERWPIGTTLGTVTVASGAQGTGAPLTTINIAAANSTITWAVSDWNAIAPGTPTYLDSPTQEAIHDKSPSNYVAYYAYQTALATGSNNFGLTLPTGQKWSAVGIEIKAVPIGPPSTPVNQIVETDTAQPITKRKIKTVGQVIETDTLQVITKRKIKTVLQVVEADAAQVVTVRIPPMVRTATEIDSAQPITPRKIKILNRSAELEAPQPIRPIHRRTIGQIIENDTVTSVGKLKTKLVAQTLETDSAQIIKISGRVFQILETDLAQPIKATKFKTVGQLVELDTVTSISKRKVRTLNQTIETDTVTAILKPNNHVVHTVTELDIAQSIKAISRKTLGQPTDIDTALIITPRRSRIVLINAAMEIDSPTTLLAVKSIALGVALETELARTINYSTVLPPPPDGVITTVKIVPTTFTVFTSPYITNTPIVHQIDVPISGYNVTVIL